MHDMKKLQFVEIKRQCVYSNLVPVYEVFHVYENIKCEKCGKAITEPKELVTIKRLKNACALTTRDNND